MAMSVVKSNIPVRGIMRRSGARIGSETLSRSKVSVFGLGENHDRIARIKIAMESNWQTKLINPNSNVTCLFPQFLGFVIGSGHCLHHYLGEFSIFQLEQSLGSGAAG